MDNIVDGAIDFLERIEEIPRQRQASQAEIRRTAGAAISEAPGALKPVPVELIRPAVEECHPVSTTTVEMPGDVQPPPADEDEDFGFGKLDLADLPPDRVSYVVERLREWGLTPGRPVQRGAWIQIPIGRCLFHPDEHPAKVTINVRLGGGIAYGCFGGRCRGMHEGIPRKTWRNVRAHFGDTATEEEGGHRGAQAEPGGADDHPARLQEKSYQG
jgi:hypothetical protein